MENRNKEVTTSKELTNMTCVATFENHYKAMLFKKGMGEECVLKPVPRLLSSSCGTAAFFSLSQVNNCPDNSFQENCNSQEHCALQLNLTKELKSLVEAIYKMESKEGDKDGRFVEIYRENNKL